MVAVRALDQTIFLVERYAIFRLVTSINKILFTSDLPRARHSIVFIHYETMDLFMYFNFVQKSNFSTGTYFSIIWWATSASMLSVEIVYASWSRTH